MGTTSSIAQALLQELKTQAISDLIVPLNTTLNNIKTTPDTQEVVMQAPQLLAAIYALTPHLEAQAITDLATAIQTWVGTITPAAPTTTAPAAA